MSKRRVFVIWNHPLFFETVRLLIKDANIEWVGACRNVDEAKSQIAQLQPDTILIEELEGGDTSTRVIEILETSVFNPRIFRLNLNDNEIRIYHREQKSVMQAEDLLHLIRSKH